MTEIMLLQVGSVPGLDGDFEVWVRMRYFGMNGRAEDNEDENGPGSKRGFRLQVNNTTFCTFYRAIPIPLPVYLTQFGPEEDTRFTLLKLSVMRFRQI